jgi:flagellar hook-associated protein 1 FlgK
MNAALSGLVVSSRLAGVISSNVANAMTPGYGRREAELTTGIAPGVQLVAILRDVDTALLTDRRIAGAASGGAETRSAFLSRFETALGGIDPVASLSARVAALDSALREAAGRPDAEVRLQAAITAAGRLAGQLNTASAAVQQARGEADAGIASDVVRLNDALARVAGLNERIRLATASGAETAALVDLRQSQIDGISDIVPIREIARENGEVALYTTGGAALVDGRASVFGFEPRRIVTANMTREDGRLSGLTLNGQPILAGETGLIGGGSLAARFTVRDTLGPAAQTELDTLARDLVERFSATGIDSTIAGGPGLFTDAGGAFDPAAEIGLAGRIALNGALENAPWRLRDGLGATSPGPVGEAALLNRLTAALTGGIRSFAGHVSDMVSDIASGRLAAEEEMGFASARETALQHQEMARGVDTDQEMQKLLLVEQSYAANARVMQTIDGLLARLMEI